jgi:type VI secretion system secreted protein VgrG
MGQPAARVTDMHTCPMVTGIVPHVGGPIIPPCQPNVLTCMMPQARISDMAICVGPIDVIVQGAFTVLVGGLPAARMGDMTAHGGVIVTGCFTVLIGDAGAGGGGGGGTSAGPAAPNAAGAAPKPGDPVKLDDDMLKKSPTLSKQLEQLQKDGWKIEYGDSGKGSFANKGSKKITIDPNNAASPENLTQTVSHEVGHALYTGKPDTSSKKAYVDSQLADEGAATLNNVKVRREILKNGGKDIGIAGTKGKEYDAVYDDYLKDGDEGKARDKIGQIFGDGEKTSNTGQTYNDYYGSFYDKNLKPKGSK